MVREFYGAVEALYRSRLRLFFVINLAVTEQQLGAIVKAQKRGRAGLGMPRHFPALGRFQIDKTGFQVQPKGQDFAFSLLQRPSAKTIVENRLTKGAAGQIKPRQRADVTGFAVRSLDKLVQDNYEA